MKVSRKFLTVDPLVSMDTYAHEFTAQPTFYNRCESMLFDLNSPQLTLPDCMLPNRALQDSIGCTEVCGDGTPFIKQHLGWQGALTLIRQATFDPLTSTLRFQPVQEYERLRMQPPLVQTATTFPPTSNTSEASQDDVNASDNNTVTETMLEGMGSVVLLPVREPAAIVPQESGDFTVTPQNATAEAAVLLSNVSTTPLSQLNQGPYQGQARGNMFDNQIMSIQTRTDGRQVEVVVTCSLYYNTSAESVEPNSEGDDNEGRVWRLILRINTGEHMAFCMYVLM